MIADFENLSDSESVSVTDTDPNNYQIRTNICKRLSKELNLSEITYDERLKDWTPPKTHGLSNSEQIIPSYYKLHEKPDKMFNINYIEIIKDDIRNFRKLNQYQMEYVRNLSAIEKNELLVIYNDCIGLVNDILLN